MAPPRIISGTARGIRLKDVPGNTTRPITDRVKEALFNILGTDIIDSEFLDLFGGTGSVGIEALSRGAKNTTFIDSSFPACAIISQNLKLTHFESQGKVLHQDAFKFLRHINKQKYSYIFIAPPQYKGLWLQSLSIIDQVPDLLEDDGSLIVQINPVEYLEPRLINFSEYDRRKYGSTILLFYEKKIK